MELRKKCEGVDRDSVSCRWGRFRLQALIGRDAMKTTTLEGG